MKVARVRGERLRAHALLRQYVGGGLGEAMSDGGGEPSAAIRARVVAARERQARRLTGDALLTNAELTPALMTTHCARSPAALRVLRAAAVRMTLSARGYDRVRKVARTIADLAGEDTIGADAIGEALQYRMV
jgi:magnesium chelatase family protein